MMELAEVRRRRAEGQTLQVIANQAGTSRQAIHVRLRKTRKWTATGELHDFCGSRLYRTTGRNGWAYTVCGGCVHHTTDRRAA